MVGRIRHMRSILLFILMVEDFAPNGSPDGRTLVFNYGTPMQGDRIGLIALDGGAPRIPGGSLAASDPDWLS